MTTATATKITRTTIPAQRGKLDQAQHFPLWKLTQAARLYPEQIRARDEAILRLKRNEYTNEVDKMSDQAAAQQGNAIIAAQTIDQGLGKTETDQKKAMLALTKAAWAAEPEKISDEQATAIAAICFHNGLDPSPASGQIYVAKIKGQQRILVSYRGMLAMAQARKKFVQRQRPMTKKEMKDFIPKWKDGDGTVGAIVEIFESEQMEQVAALIKMGIPAKYEEFAHKAFGWWRPDDNPPPTTWSAYDVAAKRALKKALRMMGLGAAQMSNPEARVSEGEDGELHITAPEPEPEASPEPETVEGEFSEVKTDAPQPDASEADAPKSDQKKQPSLSDAPPPDTAATGKGA